MAWLDHASNIPCSFIASETLPPHAFLDKPHTKFGSLFFSALFFSYGSSLVILRCSGKHSVSWWTTILHWEPGWWARITESTVQQDLLVGPDHVAKPPLSSPVDEPSEMIRNANDGCIFFCLFFPRSTHFYLG